jgi:hypothetical protein
MPPGFPPMSGMDNFYGSSSQHAPDEDADLQRVLAESMKGPYGGVQGGANQRNSVEMHDDTEDEIMRQILEQSKNEK